MSDSISNRRVFVARVCGAEPSRECGCEVCALRRDHPTLLVEYSDREGHFHEWIQPMPLAYTREDVVAFFRERKGDSAMVLPSEEDCTALADVMEEVRGGEMVEVFTWSSPTLTIHANHPGRR